MSLLDKALDCLKHAHLMVSVLAVLSQVQVLFPFNGCTAYIAGAIV